MKNLMEREAEILDTATGQFRKTNEGAIFVGSEECKKALADLRLLSKGRARFIVDWKGDDGILDTFDIDEEGFEALVGHPPKTPDEYVEIDNAHWREAMDLGEEEGS